MLVDRLGYELDPPKPVEFKTSADNFGWHKATNDKWHLLLFVEHGRVRNSNQHVLLNNIDEANKHKIDNILAKYDLSADASHLSGLRRNAIACVALNTCPLAMAEAERYLPSLITKIEPILEKNGLLNDEIKFRMTGCPNGCGRSVMGEIGFIGKSLGRYNVYLGSSHQGDRLSKLYKENLDEKQIIEEMDILLTDYANNREANEHFGDYVIRAEYVKATKEGKDFHN
ncbi:Sulfite reductase [NADPH] hemoprotein beta-component [Nymphon striatum]|nr:Sulfite reductase [NADPH] hemoprotein beta-component [Nymphon striatum]